MRYELSDYEWTAIEPMLPNKPRGVRMAGACCQSARQR
jgi:transposase